MSKRSKRILLRTKVVLVVYGITAIITNDLPWFIISVIPAISSYILGYKEAQEDDAEEVGETE